jgi:hypothetical protein
METPFRMLASYNILERRRKNADAGQLETTVLPRESKIAERYEYLRVVERFQR